MVVDGNEDQGSISLVSFISVSYVHSWYFSTLRVVVYEDPSEVGAHVSRSMCGRTVRSS